jgi:DNA-directed RNA polymerase subunit RPC12/RpoP
MGALPDSDTTYEVVCPHCGKPFEAQPLTGGAPRYQGFKCPHCRLFVAYERAEEPGRTNGSEA